MKNFFEFDRSNEKTDSVRVKNKPEKIVVRKRRPLWQKIVTFVLAVLVTLAITRVSYIGGSFLDSFAFGLLFGYMRFAFYALVYINLINVVFNLQYYKKWRFFNLTAIIFFLIVSAWIFAIYYATNSASPAPDTYSFSSVWNLFGDNVRTAWKNVGQVTGNYSDIPSGFLGVFITSIFYAIPNPDGAQAVFWIFTITITLIFVGIFIFKDYFFLGRLFEFISKILYLFSKNLVVRNYYGVRILIAKSYLKKNKSNSENSDYQSKQKIFYQLEEKAEEVSQPLISETQEIIRTTILKKYYDNKNLKKSNMQPQQTNLEKTSQKVYDSAFTANKNNYQNSINKDEEKTNSIFDSHLDEMDSKKQALDEAQLNNDKQDFLNREEQPINPFYRDKIFNSSELLLFNLNRHVSNYPIFDFASLQSIKSNTLQEKSDNYLITLKSKLQDFFDNNQLPLTLTDTSANNNKLTFECEIIDKTANLEFLKTFKQDLSDKIHLDGLQVHIPLKDKETIGIEVINPYVPTCLLVVFLKHITIDNDFKPSDHSNELLIGLDRENNACVEKLDKFPSMLISGTSGSGKSTLINAFILYLITFNRPMELNLVLIDFKKIEFAIFENLPHLLCKVIYDVSDALDVLQSLLKEMQTRSKTLNQFYCHSIDDFNKGQKNSKDKIPHTVVIISEFAELMLFNNNLTETLICQLAKMGKQVGINLILASQHCSEEVFSKKIKTAISARLGFQMKSVLQMQNFVRSKKVSGLSGTGQLYYHNSINLETDKINIPFVNLKQVEKVCDFMRKNYQPCYDPHLSFLLGEPTEGSDLDTVTHTIQREAEVQNENLEVSDELLNIITYIQNKDKIYAFELMKNFYLNKKEAKAILLQLEGLDLIYQDEQAKAYYIVDLEKIDNFLDEERNVGFK